MARRKPRTTRSASARPVLPSVRAPDWLTPERRRELLGAVLVVLGVVTALAFAGAGGALTDPWLEALRWALGWGAVLAPLALGALGAWLIVEGFDSVAGSRWDRPLGVGVTLLAVVGFLHLLATFASETQDARLLAENGAGGGWIGYALANGLALNLGAAPAGVVLVVIALVGASFAAGLSLRDLGAIISRSIASVTVRLWELRASRPASSASGLETIRRTPIVDSGRPSTETVSDAADGAGSAPAAAGAGRSPGAMPGAAGDATHPWVLPASGDVLDESVDAIGDSEDAEAIGRLIEQTLAEFGVPATVIRIERGPTVTLFGLEPGTIERNGQRSRVKVSRITSLQNDLALALSASPIRIQAPVPGRPYVGVEVPNSAKALVSLRGVIESDTFKRVSANGALPIALGRDTSGRPVAADLAAMPHLLVAGATGSGKSVAINTIICTLLMCHTPDTLRLVLVDPKRVEMTQYRGLPHLATPVVVEIENVIGVLQWAVRQMDARYKSFAAAGARNLEAYNRLMTERSQAGMPYLVLIVDELADLMMIAPEDAERLITRLAQLARATGIHLVLATQRPSVDVVTGLIKANFPSRIGFAVSSSVDSRVILDSSGAEKLLGRGDMLYMASDSSKLRRLQGCFLSDAEIDRLVAYWKRSAATRPTKRTDRPGSAIDGPVVQPELFVDAADIKPVQPGRDDLFEQAVSTVRAHRTASTSFLQRKLRIGYSRAARLMDALEEAGHVSPAEGNQPRRVLIGPEGEEPGQAPMDSPAGEPRDHSSGPGDGGGPGDGAHGDDQA